MDASEALLSAVRLKAALDGRPLEPGEVETLAGAFGIAADRLPPLADAWAKAGKVRLGWGGKVEPVPESASSGGGVSIDLAGATLGAGAVIAGRDATGGTTIVAHGASLQQAAALLAALRPNLSGDAAQAASEAEDALRAPPSKDAPEPERRAWKDRALGSLGALLEKSPIALAIVELGERAVNLFP